MYYLFFLFLYKICKSNELFVLEANFLIRHIHREVFVDDSLSGLYVRFWKAPGASAG